MNHYPSWWNNTVTLYCKYEDPVTKKIKWYRYVIEDCFYKHTVEKLTVGKVTVDGSYTVCRIRVNENYVDKVNWMLLTDSERYDQFTLSGGDIIVKGDITEAIDEYLSGHRSSDLIKAYKDYPGCFTVEFVNINVGGGRGNEHYHVRGN